MPDQEIEVLRVALELALALTGDPDARLCQYIASEITEQKLSAA